MKILKQSKYNFREAKLDKKFCPEKLLKVKEFIDNGTSFTIIGMPGVGVSYFLRFLASQANYAHFIFIDMYALSTLSRLEYISWLLKELEGEATSKSEQQIFNECKERLALLAQKQPKIVIIFNRFDQLVAEFDKQFLANIRAFKYIAPEKIVMIFTSNKPLYEIASDALVVSNIHFYSPVFFFNTYSTDDLNSLTKITIPDNFKKDKQRIKRLIELSGGHNQLFMICVKSESQENLLADRFVQLQLRELYEFLSYHQQKVLQKIALGKKIDEVDSFLLNIGLVKKTNPGYELFTPLLKEYILSKGEVKIPAKEGKLFKLLKQNLGQVVSKDQIFDYVYPDDLDGASDWALNALVYRLRKNPSFKSGGFIIENYKKMGYIIYKT